HELPRARRASLRRSGRGRADRGWRRCRRGGCHHEGGLETLCARRVAFHGHAPRALRRELRSARRALWSRAASRLTPPRLKAARLRSLRTRVRSVTGRDISSQQSGPKPSDSEMEARMAAASPPRRWRQLAACIVAMMAVANLQYAWTLFTIPLTQSLN